MYQQTAQVKRNVNGSRRPNTGKVDGQNLHQLDPISKVNITRSIDQGEPLVGLVPAS